MLKNYLKIAWRNLNHSKGSTFINVLGLAVGIACCILITLYVRDELSYDRYHKNVNRIYRVLHAKRNGGDAEKLPPIAPEEFQVWGNAPVGPALLADFPEISKVAQFTSPSKLLMEYSNKRFQEDNILFADSTMFDLFSWDMVSGNPEKALTAPNSIVLTQSMAQRYFGNEDPVGKVLQSDYKGPFNVTGVMEDVPSNSHFNFSALISMSTYRQSEPDDFESWGYVDFYTYFLISEGADISKLESKIPAFLDRHYPDYYTPNSYTIAFEPLTDAYLHSKAGRQPGVTGSMEQVYIFSLIAVFMLLIACINFMNLSTARSIERAREVGVRKVVGARRLGLVSQFLVESVLCSLAAAGFALILVTIALPAIRDLSGKPFPYEQIFSWSSVPSLLILAVLTGMVAGSYPAWVMTRFQPVLVLKGKFRSSSKGILMRKGLVILQFSLSIALIVGTMIVSLQLNHIRTHDLGFKQDHMLVIDYGRDELVNREIEVVKAALNSHPAVKGISASRAVPGDFFPNAGTLIESPGGDMEGVDPAIYEIDPDFIPLYEMKMAAGRNFSNDFSTDSTQALIVNEAAAKLYGYPDPEAILGKHFEQWGRKGTVIGVVSDFNYQSLHQKVEPLALRIAPRYSLSRLSLQVKTDNLQKVIADLEVIWNNLAPQRPFLYSFLDQSFNRQYQRDMRFGELFGIFAVLTIFIAGLGLFGLSTYAAQQRVKEIGIRKVLGASVIGIVRLLSADFVKLVIVAIVAATPLAWYAMNRWLENFAYRIDIQWWVFALAGSLAVIIALLTVSFQSVKTALMNPVKALRLE